MMHQGSEAYDLDMRAPARAAGAEPEPSLVVLEGGHLDADARRGVSREFVARARLIVACAAVLCALGAARVFLTTQTVSLMQDNIQLASEVREADGLNDELRAERSLLSSSARIKLIATQSYGMVYNPPSESIDVSGGSVDAAQATD